MKSSKVVVDVSQSPLAKLLPLPLDAVRLAGFVAERQRVNREASLQYGFEKIAETGVLENLTLAASMKRGGPAGIFKGARCSSDSQFYKWLEGASFELARQDDPVLRKKVDDVIALIGEAQMEDGYINTYYQINGIEKRWTNLEEHEMYCHGHLIQAAVAHHRATGSETFLGIACRAADHIDSVFGPGKREGCSAHPEIEMALVELYRATREQRYLILARHLLGNRGKGHISGKQMFNDHRDAIGITEPEGHAVIQLYLLCGIIDAYLETGEEILFSSAAATWKSMVERRMAITGGVGVRPRGEAFGADYELPNESTYNETCAQIASLMFSWRLLLATCDAKYADEMERTFYNGILSGVDLDGKAFFYGNPLLSRPGGKRNPWNFACACCPPNVIRTLASINGYVATTSPDGIQLHLYGAAEISALLDDPAAPASINLSVATDYPWDGEVTVTVNETPEETWALSLRIPAWCESAQATVNGEAAGSPVTPGEYLRIRREWSRGDVVQLSLPMPVRYYEAHPHIDTARCAATITRGPLVYCLEGHDQTAGTHLLDLAVNLDGGDATVERRDDLLGGVTVVRVPGYARDMSSWDGIIYRPLGSDSDGQTGTRSIADREVTLTAIPYFAWANREPSPMRVWIPTTHTRADQESTVKR